MPKANYQPDIDTLRTLFQSGGETSIAVTLQAAVQAFTRAELGEKSPETRKWYERRLGSLCRALGPARALSSVMEVDLLEWYNGLKSQESRYAGGRSSRPEVPGGLSPDTLHGYVRATKRFFRWLFKKEILTADLSADLSLPKLPRRGKKGVSDEAAKEVMEAARGNTRDFALLSFIESTGIRRGGAAHLLLSDLDIRSPDARLRRRVTVREKGDKERTVVMTQKALYALELWLSERPAVMDDHVFLGKEPGSGWHALTESGISGIYRRYKARLGIRERLSPHQWRHRWCRRRLQEGVPISVVSQLAGHEDISVTVRYYGQFGIDELQDQFDEHTKD